MQMAYGWGLCPLAVDWTMAPRRRCQESLSGRGLRLHNHGTLPDTEKASGDCYLGLCGVSLPACSAKARCGLLSLQLSSVSLNG
jgi:hypothetical protein